MITKAAKTNSGMRRLVVGAFTLSSLALGASGCIEDSDCGICDPDNLVLESISGVNYASRKIHLLNPQCEGNDCPAPFNSGSYFIEEIGPCEETDEARNSPRGTEEFCKISPLVTAFGIEFVFNNLLDPTSIELVRKRPDNPQLFEVYDWKHRVVEIEGPITRFNGDFVKGATEEPDVMTRLVNLSCIENLRDEGIDYGHELEGMDNPCNAVGPNGLPRKLREVGTITSYPGRWTIGGSSCDTPEEGPDTCCTRCDYLLSTQVSKYGLSTSAPEGASYGDVAGQMRNPNTGDAIICDPAGDPFQQCADFIPWVDRSEQEIEYQYYWDCNPATDASCAPKTYGVPYYDKLRETHPTDRPAWLERRNVSCSSTAQCRSAADRNLPGTQCVGITADGAACSPQADPENCGSGVCVAEWFVTCESNNETTGDADPDTPDVQEGYCIDKRFSSRGAGACLRTASSFDALCDANGNNCQTAPANTRLAFCDHNEDGSLNSAECCQESLFSGQEAASTSSCDPVTQNVTPISIYDRNDNLPEPTKDCICPSGGTLGDIDPESNCYDSIRVGCFDSEEVRESGNAAQVRSERAGQYAVKLINSGYQGGVIYDPAIKGFEWRTADVGSVPRADIEACAETRGLIQGRNTEDGWRANDAFAPNRIEDFDRSMCSDSEYTIHFQTPEEGDQYVQDKVGNTLAGKSEYTFRTPAFHVEPGSGFPSDNLRIGACNDFSLRFSNKYDMSPENLAKLQIYQLTPPPAQNEPEIPWDERFVALIAGGPDCAETQADLDAGRGVVPCLTVDVSNQLIGEVGVEIDPTEFGPVLETGITYRLWVPGLNSVADMADPTLYANAFWDACGMPLITTGGTNEPDFLYDFTIDQPKCKEDQDLDNVQLSCDNAPNFFNPDQGDIDRDGFGDVIDKCPTLAGSSDDTADSDDDGVGNECDTCRQASRNYNKDDANPMGYMTVRNIPFQQDSDGDGIGDVCDNCVLTANCDQYGPENAWTIGDPIEFDDPILCQLDGNNDMVGDACAGDMGPIATAPIGLGPDQDFDQDGLSNVVDACPRQPVALTAEDQITCESNADCPSGRKCETAFGICDHLDSDGDGVGDICDTCPFAENPMQVADGAMQDGDDTDGDYVGNVCETNSACEKRVDSRPFSFYETSANGYCCTVALFEDDMGNLQINLPPRDDGQPQLPKPLEDPEGRPVRVDCPEAEQGVSCSKLPSSVALAPGILIPPVGCEEALDGTSPRENRKLTLDDFMGDTNALWETMCFLPQFDQDYDGLGDKCDLCRFDFDPENLPYIDANGRVWPTDGKFCNGDYSIDTKPACEEDEDPLPTGGETEGGETEGGMTDGGMTDGGMTGDSGGN